MNSILYVANARLPTEKAHGYQICQMCQAFQEAGTPVTLLHPSRKHEQDHDGGLMGYYGLRTAFPVRRLAIPDLLTTSSAAGLPALVCQAAFRAQTVMFAAAASVLCRRRSHAIPYTRDFTVAAILCRLGLPVVMEVHALSNDEVRLSKQIAVLNRCRGIVAMTGAMAESMIASGVPQRRVLVAHDAVDLETFAHAPDQDTARSALGLAPDRKIAAFVGKFHTNGMEKGIPEIIGAAALLLDRYPELDFWFVGGPLDREPQYRAQITRLNLAGERFHFLEKRPVTEVPLWLSAANILLMPHPRNPFYERDVSPLKLFEYMSASRPIVASEMASIVEILTHEHNALLGDAGDPAAIAANVDRLLNDQPLAAHLARAARADVEKHTWVNRARSIIRFLAENEAR